VCDSSLLGDNLVVLPPAIAQMVGLRVGVEVGLRVCCCGVKLGIVIKNGIAEVVSVLLSARDEVVRRAAQHLQSAMRGEAAPSLVQRTRSRPFSCSPNS
jgi:hypothetical protein